VPQLPLSGGYAGSVTVSALADWGEPADFQSHRRRSVQRFHPRITDRFDALCGALIVQNGFNPRWLVPSANVAPSSDAADTARWNGRHRCSLSIVS